MVKARNGTGRETVSIYCFSVGYIRGGNLGSSEGVDVVWFCRSSTRPTKTRVVEDVAGNGKALDFDGKSWVGFKANKTLDIAEITMAAWIYKDEVFLANLGENIISKKQAGAYSIFVGGWKTMVDVAKS